jgi:hypothetical protein
LSDIDDIEGELEKLRKLAREHPQKYGSDVNAAEARLYKAQKRQFEASLRRRAKFLRGRR